MSLPIALEHVTHAYGTASGPLPVLDDLSMEMPEGSFTAVVGPSGCGKSTLTRLVAGLMKPDRGTVRLGGEPVTGPRATVGMAFQNPVLLEWRTILQNVMLPLEIVRSGMSRIQRQDRARELLALVGLEGFEDKRPSELSGGMRQRASLCRSIVHRPEVLILDEPFGALDAFTREDLWMTMHDLRRQEAFTCVLITHDLRESVFLSDRTVVFSARPARAQKVVEIDMPGARTLDDLYAPHAVELLATLRREIQIAQGREVEAQSAPKPVPGAAARPVELVAPTAQDPSTQDPR
ncbi:MAG: ABC transporter ATP-binding protein [Jannaschia sp.]